jgi:hypothetical protein
LRPCDWRPDQRLAVGVGHQEQPLARVRRPDGVAQGPDDVSMSGNDMDISCETVQQWVPKFGPFFGQELRRQRPRPTSTWHLDEMDVVIARRQFWLKGVFRFIPT